jgi:hypothetical protein
VGDHPGLPGPFPTYFRAQVSFSSTRLAPTGPWSSTRGTNGQCRSTRLTAGRGMRTGSRCGRCGLAGRRFPAGGSSSIPSSDRRNVTASSVEVEALGRGHSPGQGQRCLVPAATEAAFEQPSPEVDRQAGQRPGQHCGESQRTDHRKVHYEVVHLRLLVRLPGVFPHAPYPLRRRNRTDNSGKNKPSVPDRFWNGSSLMACSGGAGSHSPQAKKAGRPGLPEEPIRSAGSEPNTPRWIGSRPEAPAKC